MPQALLFAVASSIATVLGGLLALRLRQRGAIVLALSSGVVLGIVMLDLLPESVELSQSAWSIHALFAWTAVGFALYMLASNLPAAERCSGSGWHDHIGPGTLTMHSLVDGLEIGLAFGVSPLAGTLVATAVLAPDLADGINVVSLCLAARRGAVAKRWLALNAAAPIIGTVLGMHVPLGPITLAPLLATIAGVFIYIGGCYLAPRSRQLDGRPATLFATLVGMTFVFGITGLGR